MRLAVVGAHKALAAEAALERLLARVAQAVAVQVAALGEGPRTQAALEWPLSSMVPQTRAQKHPPLRILVATTVAASDAWIHGDICHSSGTDSI